MEQDASGIGESLGPLRGEPVRLWEEKFRAGRHAAGNARSYTRLYLTLDCGYVDIEDAALIGSVLMANAVAHSGVPAYAEIPMRWALLQSGDLLIEVKDARRDFPGFDDAMKWEPAGGEKLRGLWIARRLGAVIAYTSEADGKTVQALLKPPDVPESLPAVPLFP